MVKDYKWREQYERNHNLMTQDILRIIKDRTRLSEGCPEV